MKTDALIEALARDVQATGLQPNWRRLAAASVLGGLFALAIVLLVFGVRPDLSDALTAALLKCAYSTAIAAAAFPLAYLLAQPNTGAGRWVLPGLAAVALSLSVAAIALVTTSPSERLAAWLAGEFPTCLSRIPMLAVPATVALLLAARGLAPTRLTLAGAALGGLAGAIAAFAYSWFCQVDSVAYVATWYLVSILLCAGIGALLGRWLLRW